MEKINMYQKIYEDLINQVNPETIEKADKMISSKKVNITKVIFDDEENFELQSNIKYQQEKNKITTTNKHNVYIKVAEGEIENLSCTCEEYKKSYCACDHIIATLKEFINNPDYIRIFAGNQGTSRMQIKEKEDNIENYKVFNQLVKEFYNINEEDTEENISQNKPEGTIHIEPRIMYSKYNNTLKLEIKIGEKQMYKVKSLPEFYDRFLNEEKYKYGTKLEFIHTREKFVTEDRKLLDFVLKYAEIIKYANESSTGYDYYTKRLGEDAIIISNSGLDELFTALENRAVMMENQYSTDSVIFIPKEPDIKFELQEINLKEYKITTNIDIYDYTIYNGKKYTYLLLGKNLYRCSNKYKDTIIRLLEIFRKNFTKEIILPEGQLPNFFSIVEPSIKSNLQINDEQYKKIKKYIPAQLYAKLYLDYNEKNYIVANVKFIYDDIEINPLDNKEHSEILSRNTIKETKLLNMFVKTGFMLDQKNNRLILANEEKIYEFLTNEINLYMKNFEVLATDNFKQKEVTSSQTVNLGVRIENNLLDIDFSNLNFNSDELQEIMKKYKLKKKYHRLKNGSFVNLEDNDTLKFIDSITEDIDVDYSRIKNNTLQLPMYRALYLDKILEKNNFVRVTKDEKYKDLIEHIDVKEIEGDIELPKCLNANLREYQKIGVQWLRMLDYYGLGGILADDMGLGKTVQLLCVICAYLEDENSKTINNNIETGEKDSETVYNTETSEKDSETIYKTENGAKNVENEPENNKIVAKKKPVLVVCPSSLSLNWQNEIEKFTIGVTSQVIHGTLEERQKQIASIPQFNITITSYELLKRDIEEYKKYDYQFKYIIADEAQYIKNNNTQNAKAIKNINAETRFALTGTPIENSLSELWSIFDFIMPGYLFGYRKFKELYETPIIKENDDQSMQKLKKIIEPFVLRRIKGEVLTELPDKTITMLNSQMLPEQQDIYLSYLAQAKKNAMEEIKENGIEKSQIKILALLTRLRQICCHPSLFIENYKGGSGKLNQCIEIIKDAIQGGHKILLFSGYTAMFEIIEKELEKENIEYLKLTGQTKVNERISLVDEFNNNPDKKLFLISLKAGGTGLNLIGADMVIHYDPWWNISAENQATDRTYRIGQKRNVQVYKLITKNSIEEKIYDLQKRKETLIDNMLSTNQTFISKLSKEDIMNLFE